MRRRRDPRRARDARRELEPIGFALHVQDGAIFGAAYARLKLAVPGRAVLRGLLVGLLEHVATWPMTVLVDRYHPARKDLPKLAANPRAFGQATIRHAVFGIASRQPGLSNRRLM